MIKRMLLLWVLFYLVGCSQLYPTTVSPPRFPKLTIQDIPRKYGGMSNDEVKRNINPIMKQLQHLDLYIEKVHEWVLNEPYITRTEWRKHCLHPLRIEKFILPKHSIHDDSRLPDIAIINALIQYVHRIRADVNRYNQQLENTLQQFKTHCNL